MIIFVALVGLVFAIKAQVRFSEVLAYQHSITSAMEINADDRRVLLACRAPLNCHLVVPLRCRLQ